MSIIDIHSNVHDYSLAVQDSGEFILPLIGEEQNSFIVIDENVYRLYPQFFAGIPQNRLFVLQATETNKDLASVQLIYDRLIEFNAKKNITLISIGGGIIQDISGFVASTLYRGIHWVFVPTTLLAQADSCIGAKTSLNYNSFKNLIGTFYPPHKILLWPDFVLTQDAENFASGVGEIVKLCLLAGNPDIPKLSRDIALLQEKDPATIAAYVHTGLMTKLSYIEQDEFDTGLRNMLNYGHCIGHAIEYSSNYRIPHGQAVVIGMILANRISQDKGLLSVSRCEEIEQQVLKPALVIRPDASDLDPDLVISAMKKDKKRQGENLSVVLMDEDYQFHLDPDVPEELTRNCLSTYQSEL